MANSVDPGQMLQGTAYFLNVQNQDFKLFGLKFGLVKYSEGQSLSLSNRFFFAAAGLV